MGLCKCPKKTVTNLFCYEHRVNVCEYCMTIAHPSCVIQSYLSWLQDADFDSNCQFCSDPLSSRECVRLGCYHVFHWSCLRSYFDGFSVTKGTCKCTVCSAPIAYNSSELSPVANELCNKLSGTTWGRSLVNAANEPPGSSAKPLNEKQTSSNSACYRNKSERFLANSLFSSTSYTHALYTIDEDGVGKYSKRRLKSSVSTKLTHLRKSMICKLICACIATMIVTCIVALSFFDQIEPADVPRLESRL